MENTNLGLIAGKVLNPRPSLVWRQCLEGKSDLKEEEGNHGILKALKRIQTNPHTVGAGKRGGEGVLSLEAALAPEQEVITSFGMWPLKSHLSQWLLVADNTEGLLRRTSAFHAKILISFSLAMDYLFWMILGGRGNANSLDR